MNRRDLLKFLLATPLAASLDYEKLLWIPKPQIVVPELSSVSYKQMQFKLGDFVAVNINGEIYKAGITDIIIGVYAGEQKIITNGFSFVTKL